MKIEIAEMAKREGAMRRGVFEIEMPITRAETCQVALNKLIEYIENQEDLKEIMFRVVLDLDHDLCSTRKIFSEMHDAMAGHTDA